MGNPETETEGQRQLITSARERAQELIGGFVGATAPEDPVQRSCERATALVDRYCCDLLGDMIARLQPATPDDIAWLRSQYLALIVEFGCAVRDAIKDSETRHAAAQGIQYQVLEHERHLRLALETATLAHSPVVEITLPKPADPPVLRTNQFVN
jgi:hypothetical protein